MKIGSEHLAIIIFAVVATLTIVAVVIRLLSLQRKGEIKREDIIADDNIDLGVWMSKHLRSMDECYAQLDIIIDKARRHSKRKEESKKRYRKYHVSQ